MIEVAGPEQAEELAALHASAFDRGWTAAEIVHMLDNPAVFALVEREGGARGLVMAWVAAGDSELLTIAVAPQARRAGLGEALVNAACAAALVRGAGSMHLEVAVDNAAARALYKKLGFEVAGSRRDYYERPGGAVDAVVMRRSLPRPQV
jgi:[ribosomal protein S18]-alanine N-acetyltransferase